MSKDYDPKEIEKKWQKVWQEKQSYDVTEDASKSKFYALMEFPYPSGDGLHAGHVRGYTAMDIVARKRRMEGHNVLYPIGWDAFGLPTENYAIKTGRPPAEITKENTDNFREQFKRLGMSFDWSREVNTTDPAYYKWTQWLFLKFLENDLAYKSKMVINWCPKCKIGLANEEVVDGKCERCGTEVEKREKEQWMLAITKYADRLHDDLDEVDYPDRVKAQQRNWIGRSEGTEISFELIVDSLQNESLQTENSKLQTVNVFTTRPDTIFGATYLVLSPEHPFVQEQILNPKSEILNKSEIEKYVNETKRKSEMDRVAEGKDKTGVELKGVRAINPANQEEIPVWIADYVLPHYGTGAIMAVPADDERDREFAEKFNLPIVEGYTPAGFEDFGKKVTKYKLRDWIFSRQRYWGEPIPVIHCDKCGVVPVPEKDLPVILPEVLNYQPTDTGESPLANISEWVNVKCPKCGGAGKRETDTMPNWAGSSWYFIAYCISENLKSQTPVSKQITNAEIQNKLKYWMPVDWYNGGMEHTTLHLLYSRFWNKFLFDLGLVPTSEPYKKRTSHGIVLAENGEKMSKSRGNVINPDSIIERFGADTLRLYEMFMGPFEQAIAWNESSLVGPRRFLEKVWKLRERVTNQHNSDRLTRSSATGSDTDQNYVGVSTLIHQTIKQITENIESMKMNTAISALMILANVFDDQKSILTEDYETLLKLLAPFAPHMTEELWAELGHEDSIHSEVWPTYDQDKLVSAEVTLAVQINGKVRATLVVPTSATEDEITAKTLALPEVEKWLEGKEPKKVIVVTGKIVSIVV